MTALLSMQKRFAISVLVSSLLIVAGCSPRDAATRDAVTESWSPEAGATVVGISADSVHLEIRDRLKAGSRPSGVDQDDWRRITALYESYDARPLWYREDGLDRRARQLLTALTEAHEDGLRRSGYPLADLNTALRRVEQEQPTSRSVAEADMLLTAAYVTYAEDLLTGQIDPDLVTDSWHVEPTSVDIDSLVARMLRSEPLDRALARLRPSTDDYAELREQLPRYREIVRRGGWERIPGGSTIAPGDTTDLDRLRALVARLAAEGYADERRRLHSIIDESGGAAGRAVYDSSLARSVADFQRRHHLEMDGVLGPATLEAMNRSAEYRLRQIAANLERHRWLPRDLGGRYVLVNVPAFHLAAYEGGSPELEMSVVVGAEYDDRATPAFSDSVSYLEFAPYWNVPTNIAIREIVPAASRDPGYMTRNGYEVVGGWDPNAPVLGTHVPSADALRSGRVRIRQRPGPQNAMGQVKFMFPNDFAIYLHDTPAQALFERNVRAGSHGCIRIEKPAELAQWLLGWDEDRVEGALNGSNRRVDLEAKVPVYIVYFTTYVRDGELFFGNDLYDRDQRLVDVIASAAMPQEDAAAIEELRALARGS